MSVIDEVLATVDAPTRKTLTVVRAAIVAAAPEATEARLYGVPGFRLHGKPLAGFMPWKKHLSYYPMSGQVLQVLKKDLARFTTFNGTLQFSNENPLRATLVKKLVRARIAELSLKAAARRPAKAKGSTRRAR